MALGTRRRRKVERIEGRDRYFIEPVGFNRWQAKHDDAQLALVEAQHAATISDNPVELHVVRQPLLGGQEHVAYRVIRDEDGVVLTYIEED